MLKKELVEMVNTISNSLNTFTSAIFLINKQYEKVYLEAVQSLSTQIANGLSIDIGQGMIGWVAKNQKPLNVAKYRWDNKHFQLYLKDEGINSFLAVPIISGREIIGVLCVDSKKQYVFTNKLQKIILGFAGQIALILKRYEELGKIKVRAEHFEQLFYFCRQLNNFKEDTEFYSNIVNLACEILRADFCLLAILDKSRNVWKIRIGNGYLNDFQMRKNFPVNQGLSGLAFKEEKPLLIPSLNLMNERSFVFAREEPRWMLKSYIGVKLSVKKEVIGLLHFISKTPNHFKKEDSQIAAILGEQTENAMENNMLFQRIHEINYLDHLTGLDNHTSCQEKILSAIENASYLNPLVLLILDIDKFGAINERYGYKVGEHILRKLSAIIVSIVKERDLVARYGGDEFAILLKNIRPKDSKIVAERVRQVIERSIFTMDTIEIKITLSIGISIYPMDAKTGALFTEAALHALKTAKQSGGNTVATFK